MAQNITRHLLACSAIQLRMIANFRGYVSLVASYLAKNDKKTLFQLSDVYAQLSNDARSVSAFYAKFLQACAQNGYGGPQIASIDAEFYALKQDQFDKYFLSNYILSLHGSAVDATQSNEDLIIELLQQRQSDSGIYEQLEQKTVENRRLQEELARNEHAYPGKIGYQYLELEKEHELLQQNYQQQAALINELHGEVLHLRERAELQKKAEAYGPGLRKDWSAGNCYQISAALGLIRSCIGTEGAQNEEHLTLELLTRELGALCYKYSAYGDELRNARQWLQTTEKSGFSRAKLLETCRLLFEPSGDGDGECLRQHVSRLLETKKSYCAQLRAIETQQEEINKLAKELLATV